MQKKEEFDAIVVGSGIFGGWAAKELCEQGLKVLMLERGRSLEHPNGSDQVGRNLMDHHKGSGATADVDGFLDKYYYGQRPNQVYLPRFRNLKEKSKDFIRGYGIQGGAGRDGWGSVSRNLSIGEPLKDKNREFRPYRGVS